MSTETAVAMRVADRLALSVTPLINAGGASTEKSGSRMRPEALAAMNGAVGQYVISILLTSNEGNCTQRLMGLLVAGAGTTPSTSCLTQRARWWWS